MYKDDIYGENPQIKQNFLQTIKRAHAKYPLNPSLVANLYDSMYDYVRISNMEQISEVYIYNTCSKL